MASGLSRLLLALAAGLVVVLAGCSETPVVSDCVPGIDPECEETEVPDDVVAGVNLTDLFAPPTAAEVDAALAMTVPTTTGEGSLVELQAAADGARRFLLQLDRDGQRVVTALARVPGAAGSSTRLPTVLILPDGTDGAAEGDFLTAPSFEFLVGDAVQVLVAYRGEALRVDGDAARSELEPDPYRADVADVRAILGLLDRVPRADPSRAAFVGIGRGGTVALLAAARGAPVGAVVTLGAPTDLFARSFRAEARTRLLGTVPAAPYPALDALVAPVLAFRDGQLDLGEARLALAQLSPARLRPGSRLPAVLALHAAGDVVVGDDQLASLRAALTSSGGTRVVELVDDETHDGLIDAPAVQRQVATFLEGVL